MMKHALLLVATLTLLWSCSKTSPEDLVRKHRREYNLTFEFIVGKTNDEVTMAIDVHNKSGGKNLQDLTVNIKAFNEAEAVIWEKMVTLDVTSIGNYATEEITLKETIPNASVELASLDISLAPDSPDSGFEKYREFMRIAR